MSSRQPPRVVPTLTEVVATAPPRARESGVTAASATLPPIDEEQLVHRIVQRVDLTLEVRLRDALARAVMEHTRVLAPLLRDKVEEVVRQSVADALAAELDALQRTRDG